MSRRKKTGFDESLLLNNRAYLHYIERLTELSMCMFDWKGLPDTVNVRFLELTLFTDGRAVFFNDEVLGYLALQVLNNGKLNLYREPESFRAYAINGYNKILTEKDGVIIYNNMLHTNSIMDVKMFARRLYNLDRIIEVNANAQKTPILLQCDEEQRLTLLNLYKEYDGNSPVIHATKNLDIKGGVTVISTGAPYIADKITQLKNQTWNEALTYLGISNLSVQKKERLVSDEVIRSLGGTIANRYSRLESRRSAADKINKIFGLDVTVDYREDFRQTDDENMIISPTEVEPEEKDRGYKSMVVDLRTR